MRTTPANGARNQLELDRAGGFARARLLRSMTQLEECGLAGALPSRFDQIILPW